MPHRPPLPPFDRESALAKVRAAEDAWNTRDRSTALDRTRTALAPHSTVLAPAAIANRPPRSASYIL